MNQEFTPVIAIRLAAALGALVLGIGVFLRRKGATAHRLPGHALWSA